jgi:hypothetical protein
MPQRYPSLRMRLLAASVSKSASMRGPNEHRRLAIRFEGCAVETGLLFTTLLMWCLVADGMLATKRRMSDKLHKTYCPSSASGLYAESRDDLHTPIAAAWGSA